MHPQSRSYDIYSSLRNAKLPNISVNYDAQNYDSPSPEKGRSQSHKNSSSLILYDYESTLKKEIESSQLREELKKERRKNKTLEAAYMEHKNSRKVE
jgi:hypothetical protein